MSPNEFPLLADENIHPDVISFLRAVGSDVVTAQELGLMASPDVEILRTAHSSNRVVLTHDRDFGTLAIANGQPMTGIIYLRPGHIQAAFTIATLTAIFASNLTPRSPFILVAQRSAESVHLRLRSI